MAYEQRGMDAAAALSLAQIKPSVLRNDKARVTALQMERLSAAAMRELDDEALGWFRRRLPWGSYGMLVRASLTAPTLGVALGRWCRHHKLLTDDIELQLKTSDKMACIELREHHKLSALREFCTVSVLRNALGVACWLIDSRIPLYRAEFHFASPPHADSYAVLFDGESRFDADASRLYFDAGYLQLPVRRDEVALKRMLQRALLLTVRPYRRDRLLVERIREALTQDPSFSRRAENLAQHLGLSCRTLHRQLAAESTSLQEIKDHVRRERAQQLLSQTAKPLKHIAAELGFGNEKSFLRAFKQWTSRTPHQYRTARLQREGD